MKNFFTLTLCFFTLSLTAQIDNFPFNPDSNSDGFISVDDLMAMLSNYGEPFELPDYTEWSVGTMNNLLEYNEDLFLLSEQLDSIEYSLNLLSQNLEEVINDSLLWTLNRDACKVSMSGTNNYEIGLNCQYVFVAIPNSGSSGGGANLRLPSDIPFEEYSVHVHVNKSGTIACGTNGTGCPTVQVQKYENGSWQDFDLINPNDFYSASGLAVQQRTYVFVNENWQILQDNYTTIPVSE